MNSAAIIWTDLGIWFVSVALFITFSSLVITLWYPIKKKKVVVHETDEYKQQRRNQLLEKICFVLREHYLNKLTVHDSLRLLNLDNEIHMRVDIEVKPQTVDEVAALLIECKKTLIVDMSQIYSIEADPNKQYQSTVKNYAEKIVELID